MHLGCDVHRWMTSHIGIVSHPYFDVTSTDGVFKIENVPPGIYTLHAWHEALGELTQSFEIRAGQTSTVDLEYSVEQAQ